MILSASRKLGKYEIVRKLGRGGMADVYLAHDVEANREVALKLVEHIADSDTRDVIEAERRGAGLQQQLAAIDPRVVRVYEFGDLDGFFFVAMEYIDGQDLAELMRRGPLAIEFATDAAIAVAETLDHAHNLETVSEGRNFQGIVHGDIKPKNIRIDAHGEVRVLDFGIAKALSLSRRLTRNEFGSVPYASPERLDSGDVNAQSDLWSLAVMLYEMVTGLQPYHAESTERLERMIRSRIPPPPAPDPCPDPLRRILMKALANDPAVRYHSAREFANELILFRTGGAGLLACAVASKRDTDATRRTVAASPSRLERSRDAETRRTAPRREPETPPQRRRQRTRQRQTHALPKRALRLFHLHARGRPACRWPACSTAPGPSTATLACAGAPRQLEREIKSEQLTDPDEVFAKWNESREVRPHILGSFRARAMPSIANSSTRPTSPSGASATIPRSSMKKIGSAPPLSSPTRSRWIPTTKPRAATCASAKATWRAWKACATTTPEQLTISAEKFAEAQKLLPRSPDPELGLALLYIYGLKDVDKADAALQQAAHSDIGSAIAEKSELADGYRDRADRLFRDALQRARIASGERSDYARRQRLHARAQPLSGHRALRQRGRQHQARPVEPR